MASDPSEDIDWAGATTREEREKNWFKSWEQGYWDHIVMKPGQNLEKYFDKLTNKKENLKILVPLCATSYDPIWFVKKGHRVVATDLAEMGAQKIFQMYQQQPVIVDVPQTKGKLYKSSDDRLKYYVGDFFLFSQDLEGQFDMIWDVGAMCAIHEKDRPDYLSVVRSLMGPKCLMMLEFPKDESGGPPYNFTEDQIKGFFGDICDVEYLDECLCDLSEAETADKTESKHDPGAHQETTESEEMKFMLQCYTVRKRD